MTTMPTTFITLVDNYDPGEDWPEGRHTIETRIDGDLADRIRARSGQTGDVVIVEEGVEGGYSEYTVEWDWTTTVRVGGTQVWERDYGSGNIDMTTLNTGESDRGALDSLLAWLDQEETP